MEGILADGARGPLDKLTGLLKELSGPLDGQESGLLKKLSGLLKVAIRGLLNNESSGLESGALLGLLNQELSGFTNGALTGFKLGLLDETGERRDGLDGAKLGLLNGALLGLDSGIKLGLESGARLGLLNGAELGLTLGLESGAKLGLKLGKDQMEGAPLLGLLLGAKLGLLNGALNGFDNGIKLGLLNGALLGLENGALLGLELGLRLRFEIGLEIEAVDGLDIGLVLSGLVDNELKGLLRGALSGLANQERDGLLRGAKLGLLKGAELGLESGALLGFKLVNNGAKLGLLDSGNDDKDPIEDKDAPSKQLGKPELTNPILEFIGKLLRLLMMFSGYSELDIGADTKSDEPTKDNNGADDMLIASPKRLSDNIFIERVLAKEVTDATSTGAIRRENNEQIALLIDSPENNTEDVNELDKDGATLLCESDGKMELGSKTA